MALNEPLWTSAELRVSCGIPSPRPWYADRLHTVAADVLPGTLYIAPETAEPVDITTALGRGAIAALVDEGISTGLKDDPRLLSVPDMPLTLQRMAVHARDRAPAVRVGVAGRMDDAVLTVLAAAFGLAEDPYGVDTGHDVASVALSRLPRSARFGLFELADDAAVAGLVSPQVVLVGNGAADAAMGLLPALDDSVTLVVDSSDKAGAAFALDARVQGRKVIDVAASGKASVRAVKIIEHSHCTCLSADIDGVPVTYKVGLPGLEWVAFSLMMLGAVKAAGADLGRAVLCLAGLGGPLEADLDDDSWAEDTAFEPFAASRRALAE